MFTSGEMSAIQSALTAANYEITRQEQEIADEQTWIGKLIFPSDRQRTLSVSRQIRDVAIRQRNFYIEDSEPRHEEALQLVEMLNKVATPGWTAQAIAQPSLVDKLGEFGKKLVAPILDNPLAGTIGKYLTLILVVAGLVALAYLASSLKAFAPNRNAKA
jgi:hypothetical protein